MKKYILMFLSLMLALSMLLGCSKNVINKDDVEIEDNNPEHIIDKSNIDDDINMNDKVEEVKEVEEPKKEVNTSFREELLKLNLKLNPYWESGDPTQTEWVKVWLNYKYKGITITNLKTNKTDNYIKYINDELNLRLEKIFVQFSSDDKIEGLEKNKYNYYTDEIYMVYADVKENNERCFYYLDVIDNDELDYLSIFDYALNVLANDVRYKDYLTALNINEKDYSVTNGVSLLDRGEILEGYSLYDVGINGDKLIFLMGMPAKIDDNGNLYHNLKICNYDYINKKITGSTDVEEIEYNESFYLSGRGFVYGSGKRNYIIDGEGKINLLEDNEQVNSPDNKFCVYTDEDRNLFVKNQENGEIVITLNSINDKNQGASPKDYNGYRIYKWIDNESFIYQMTGYEWSNGFGLLNIITGENTVIEDSKGKNIYKLVDNKLYAGYLGGYGEISIQYWLL